MPTLNRTALLRLAAIVIVAVTVAVGLFFTVRALDSPSVAEMARIESTVEDFFKTYDATWPADHYEDPTLRPEVRAAMRSQKQQALRRTVAGDLLVAEMANDRVLALEELRGTEGVVVTEAGHELVELDYVRTALDRTVIVRVDVLNWRQESLWDATSSRLIDGERRSQQDSYELSVRSTDEGWRIVGLRPVTEK